MRAVVQRVLNASVTVEGRVTGQTGPGLMVLLGVQIGDTEQDMRYIADKVLHLRIFEDDVGKMNRSVLDVGGGILAVSQFTLLGDARGGRRPSFIAAEAPAAANALYERCCALWREAGVAVGQGVFGAHMEVALVNNGPVTLLLDSRKGF